MYQSTLASPPQAPLDWPELHREMERRDLEEGLNPVSQPSSQRRGAP